MPKRKKYPKLPNGYGQIRYLGKGRRNPYGVYPPATEEYDNGAKKSPKAICYVSDRMVGLAVLTAYKAGTYKPGDEIEIEKEMRSDCSGSKVLENLVSDFNRSVLLAKSNYKPTFAEVYMDYYREKFGHEYEEKAKRSSMEYSMRAAYKNSNALHDRVYETIKADDMQEVIDDTGERLSHSSAELVKILFSQLDHYCMSKDIIEKPYSAYTEIKIPDDDEHGVPFTHEELKILWQNKTDPVIEFILIMCYSGFRISEYKEIEVNLKDGYFKGGMKTKAGKNRTVPIHSSIYGLVKRRLKRYGQMIPTTTEWFRNEMYMKLEEIGISKHTPHDCRHTMNYLLTEANADRVIRYKIMGHVGKDINEKVYTHISLDQMQEEIEKIVVNVL